MKPIKALITTALLALCTISSAQGIDSVFVDCRGSFLQHGGDHYNSALAAEYFNIHAYGKIADNVSYRIRHRMNVRIDSDNPFRATDWMCINWQATDKLKLYTGKTAVMIGGYEYDAAPIDVYFYSQFCSNLMQYFAFSAGGEYELFKGQVLALQIANSPLTTGFDNKYSYNIGWIGHFAPWWNTIWSANLIDDQFGRQISYIALGNHCVWGNLAVDVDFMNRASFSQKQYFLSDVSLISKVIYTLGKWNLCGKVGYEANDSANIDSNGVAFDSTVAPGTTYLYGGCGVEYFPLGNDKIRLHLAGYLDNTSNVYTVTTGVKWRIDIYKAGNNR